MGIIHVSSHAKINLSLDITGRRPDGYHLVEMIMQSLSLKDNIIIKLERSTAAAAPPLTISLTASNGSIPCNSSNTVYKAAETLFNSLVLHTGQLPSLHLTVHIEKYIPVSAGLAGGSGNAAALIYAMFEPELWDNVLDLYSLLPVEMIDELKRNSCIQTGADVLYCMSGKTVLAEGIGEILTPISPSLPDDISVLLIKPQYGITTKWSYSEFDKLNNSSIKHPYTDYVIKAIQEGNLQGISTNSFNVLEIPALKKYPEILKLKDTLMESGADFTMMTGSGPTVFGMFKNSSTADNAFHKKHLFSDNTFISLTKTCRGGIIKNS